VTLQPTTGGANGSVVDRLGQAVVDTPVRVSGATNPALGGTVRTVSQPPGQFVVAGLDAGPYVFEISDAASGFVTQRRTVDIVAGGIVPLGTIVVESVDSVQVFDQTESAERLVVRGLDGAVLEEVPYEGGVAAFAGLPHGSLVTFEAFTANDALRARAAVVLEAEMSFPAFEGPD
jgi:hypothetical protein